MRIGWKCVGALLAVAVACAGEEKIHVVASLPNLGSIAAAVGGDEVEVASIAAGSQDEHSVDPKPSFMTLLRDAQVLFVNGLELEVGWIPPLVDGSRNPEIRPGSSGYVDCSVGIATIEKPNVDTTRAKGDVHPLGNPHYLLDPLNAKVVARTMAEALTRIRPAGAEGFEGRCKEFCRRIDVALFGEKLVDAVGGSKLCRMLEAGDLWDYLAKESVDGQPLASQIGGWIAAAAPARGKKIITYHKSLSYLVHRFGIEVAEYVEPKPGIQPSPAHLAELVGLMRDGGIRVVVRFPFNEGKSTDLLAEKAGGKAVVVPLEVGGADGVDDYFKLMDRIVGEIAAACGS